MVVVVVSLGFVLLNRFLREKTFILLFSENIREIDLECWFGFHVIKPFKIYNKLSFLFSNILISPEKYQALLLNRSSLFLHILPCMDSAPLKHLILKFHRMGSL